MSVLNKTALVTGSTSGIGLTTARALAKRGVNVIITGFGDENVISGIVEELKGYGVRIDYVSADLSKVTDIETLCSQVMQLYPDGIDILVSNAGVLNLNPVDKISDSEWDEQIAVILSAAFHLIKRCLPAMKRKGWGRIVNTSSIAGLVAHPNMAAYVVAKHGLIGLTKGVALENAAHGITCNAICPTGVATPLAAKVARHLAVEKGQPIEGIEKRLEKDQMKPEHVAELIEFLCLSDASSQITGASYLIDRGDTAQ